MCKGLALASAKWLGQSRGAGPAAGELVDGSARPNLRPIHRHGPSGIAFHGLGGRWDRFRRSDSFEGEAGNRARPVRRAKRQLNSAVRATPILADNRWARARNAKGLLLSGICLAGGGPRVPGRRCEPSSKTYSRGGSGPLFTHWRAWRSNVRGGHRAAGPGGRGRTDGGGRSGTLGAGRGRDRCAWPEAELGNEDWHLLPRWALRWPAAGLGPCWAAARGR